MSKIIEALEKAKSQGTLDRMVDTVDERDTLAAAAPEEAPAPAPQRNNRSRAVNARHLKTVNLDAEVLKGVDRHLETLHKPMSVVSEQYRALRNRIERQDLHAATQTLAITSSVKGEGKSLTASNLAVVMAQDATRQVLLLDADLRRPKLHKLLNLPQGPGLADHLQGDAEADDILQATPFFGLTVVSAGDTQGHPSEMLASPELQNFLREQRRRFDYIIIDTPPLHPISDVSFLVEAVDAVLLVVRANKTGRGLVKQAADSLPPGKLMGTLLNRSDSLRQGYGYGYGKGGYYYKYY